MRRSLECTSPQKYLSDRGFRRSACPPSATGRHARDPSERFRRSAQRPALAEMLLHLIETAAKLLDKLIKGGKLNGGLCDFCLLRNDGFARRGILAQDFHSEGHGSRGHSAEALYRFLGYELIRASCFERVLRDSSLDAQFCRATGDVRQRAHVGRDDAILLR